jgi:sulfite reductase alpha subunit-like flavoprotein
VCGDAASMAGDVHEVLKEIIATSGRADPLTYIARLETEKRYQRDIWF